MFAITRLTNQIADQCRLWDSVRPTATHHPCCHLEVQLNSGAVIAQKNTNFRSIIKQLLFRKHLICCFSCFLIGIN